MLGSNFAEDVEDELTSWTGQLFGADSSVADALGALFDDSSTSALTVGIIATIYTASRGFAAVVRALDVAYGHHNTRGWVGTQVIGLLLALGSIVVGTVTMTGLVIGPLLGFEGALGDGVVSDVLQWLWKWFRFPVAAATLVLWAATIYHVAPNRRASWRWELPGARSPPFCGRSLRPGSACTSTRSARETRSSALSGPRSRSSSGSICSRSD